MLKNNIDDAISQMPTAYEKENAWSALQTARRTIERQKVTIARLKRAKPTSMAEYAASKGLKSKIYLEGKGGSTVASIIQRGVRSRVGSKKRSAKLKADLPPRAALIQRAKRAGVAFQRPSTKYAGRKVFLPSATIKANLGLSRLGLD